MSPWYVGSIITDRIEVFASAVGWTPYIPSLPPETEAGDLAIGWLMESQGVTLNGWNDVVVGSVSSSYTYRGHILHKIVSGPSEPTPQTPSTFPQPVGAWVIVKGGQIGEIKGDSSGSVRGLSGVAPALDGQYVFNLRFLGHIDFDGFGAGQSSVGEEIVRVPLSGDHTIGQNGGTSADIWFHGSRDNYGGSVSRPHYNTHGSQWVCVSVGIARK